MKDSTHKFGRPYHRKLHIGGEEWSWRVAGFDIYVRSPDGNRTLHFNSFELHGTTQDEWYASFSEDAWEMAEYYGGCNPEITPGLVKKFVEEHLAVAK